MRTALTGLAGIAIFLLLDPLVVRYFDKFRSDIKVWVIDPLSGTSKPEWIAQFADVNAHAVLVHEPAVVGAGAGARDLGDCRRALAAVAARSDVTPDARRFRSWLLAVGGQDRHLAPFIRYTVPLAPPLAVAAAALSADLCDARAGPA